jgi:hypothetical protein
MHVCLIFLCITSALPCFAEGVEEINNISEKELIALEKVEVITLGSREKAESFAAELERSGYKTIVTAEDKGARQNFKVFILVNKNDRNIPDLSGGLSQGPADNKTTQDEAPGGYKPDKKSSWEILGRRHRYVHGSLTLSGIYTDNALNSRTDKKSDFSTILTPQIWLGFPLSLNLGPLSISLRSPGGRLLTKQSSDSQSRFQASLYYIPNIALTSSSGGLAYGKVPAQTLGGSLSYLGNRFSLLAEDQYEFSQQEQRSGVAATPGVNDRYNSNLLNLSLSYTSRNRLGFQLGYSNFTTGYKSELNSFRDRQDNVFYASAAYKLSHKMGLIVDYKYLIISYDNSGELDSNEHYLMGGISWNITAKSKGLLKAGYGVKKFDSSGRSFSSISFEGQLDHRFTPKTSLAFSAYRKTSETNVTGMAFSLTNGLEVKLNHSMNPRLTSSAGFLIVNDHYKTFPELTGGFDSRLYRVNLSLQYTFRRWLKGGIGYAYTINNSSRSELEYRSNMFYFNITSEI